MGFERLLGRFSAEETEFLRKVNGEYIEDQNISESRGGLMKTGRVMPAEYDLIPSENEMRRFTEESLRRLYGNVER